MKNTLLVVFGQKGSGKTTFVRGIVDTRDRVIVVDLMSEYGPEVGVVPLEGDRETIVRGVAALAKERRFRVSVRAFDLSDNLAALWVAKEIPRTLVVVEEASMLTSAYQLPDELAWLVRYGRHREIDLVFVSRRPAEVSRDITANADLVVTFRQTEPNDLLYLRARGFDPDEVRTLPPYKTAFVGEESAMPFPYTPEPRENALTEPAEGL